ncbi:MAG: wax ester/triacylglycerol synthase family O-acyltransferase [Rhodoferax sp.]|nr:wax ester/triacylglycerol synthase family O-acyltransferase [Rhodoferax sp.]
MHHLSGLDASFLYLETPEQPMHVGSLNIYELPPGFEGDFLDTLRQHIGARMHLAPVFQRKLVNMPFELANPVWVADDDIDMEYHIRSTVLPKPGSRAQLDKLVGRLHSSLLDRSRPLWEFYVIEGVQSPADSPPGTRHVAFYSKVHHAALDGAGGIALANAIMDIGPVPRHVRAAPSRRFVPTDNFGVAELAMAGIKNTAQQTIKLVKTVPALASALVGLVRAGRESNRDVGGAKAPKTNWFAPRTPINVSVTNQRFFASFSVPLEKIKTIAKGNEVSLNDVVLAICSGALRHYLADRGCVLSDPLLAAVPVSLREAGNTDLNNQVSMMRVSLASTVADPLERLRCIKLSSAAAKAISASMKSVTPTDFPSLGAPWLISGLASLFGRSKLANTMPPIANVAISNVPGPKFALYMAGARVLTYYPVPIAVHSMALNVTVQSYNGSLDFGLTACRKALPDLPELARLMEAAHRELLKLTPGPVVERPREHAAAPVTIVPVKPLVAKKRAAKRTAARKPVAPLKLVIGATRTMRIKRGTA